MDSTSDKRIAAMRSSLMDTALEAAESRGQGLAGVAHALYALYRDDGFAGRLLRAHGLESAEIRRLMGTVPNMPLADGGKPVPNLSTRRILKHANDTLEVLRYLQGNDQVAGLLASHGIGKPDRQPTQAQVLPRRKRASKPPDRWLPDGTAGWIPATSPAYGSCSRPRSTEKSPTDMRKVETKIPDESALYLRQLRTEQERKEFEERYGLRLETNTPLSPFLEHLMLDMHPIFPNVSHRTVLTNMGAWNPQTVRENARRITDGNMLKKYMDDNRKVS